MNLHGHSFEKYGAEERICMKCGFVTWMFDTEEGGDSALRQLGGGTCPKVWHGKHGALPTRESLGFPELSDEVR